MSAAWECWNRGDFRILIPRTALGILDFLDSLSPDCLGLELLGLGEHLGELFDEVFAFLLLECPVLDALGQGLLLFGQTF